MEEEERQNQLEDKERLIKQGKGEGFWKEEKRLSPQKREWYHVQEKRKKLRGKGGMEAALLCHGDRRRKEESSIKMTGMTMSTVRFESPIKLV